MRREVLDQVGLFDESLPACEDYDLWLRISSRYPIHLVPGSPLVSKRGGHPDQQSQKYRGMDRFRIQSIVKLLQNEQLTNEQRELALLELKSRCTIFGNGCLKHGRIEAGAHYLSLPKKMALSNQSSENKNASDLLPL